MAITHPAGRTLRTKKVRDWDEYRFQLFSTIFIALFIVLCLIPFLNIIAKSFSDEASVLGGRVTVWPINFNIKAYKVVLLNPEFIRSLGISVFVTIIGTTMNIIATVLVAYPLSKDYLKGQRVFRFLYIFTMLFSGGLIPTYLVVRACGLLDNLLALILPNLVGVFQMILVSNYFITIPVDIEESAKMDGASNFIILIRIMIPLAMPVIATIILFYAVGHWNEFFAALMYLNRRDLRPLQIYLRDLILQADNNQMNADIMRDVPMESVQGATLVAATVPILVVYPFLQRYFVKGITVGAVKQ
jgi:putative aldouronate transport system permease protein